MVVNPNEAVYMVFVSVNRLTRFCLIYFLITTSWCLSAIGYVHNFKYLGHRIAIYDDDTDDVDMKEKQLICSFVLIL
jgi:hypothetical protein